MSHVTPMQTSFNGGELSPRIRDRIDLAVRQIGAEEMDGWLPTLQGPAEACAGPIYLSDAPAGKLRLQAYVFNATQSYGLIFSAG